MTNITPILINTFKRINILLSACNDTKGMRIIENPGPDHRFIFGVGGE
jgi:hypothetical protein